MKSLNRAWYLNGKTILGASDMVFRRFDMMYLLNVRMGQEAHSSERCLCTCRTSAS